MARREDRRDDAQALERWLPHLIRVWRKAQASSGRGGHGGSGRAATRGDRRGPREGSRGDPERGMAPEATLTPAELSTVAAGVRELSLGLTRERALAGARYMDDPRLLGAYLLFYWPVSYAQARQVLNELPQKPRETLDLGSGPGPVAFAALDAGASQVTCAERSRPALAIARELAAEVGEALATREWTPEQPLPEGTFDTITLGHVLNELFGKPPQATPKRVALLEQALGRLKRGGTLLVIEPALRETSRGLLEVRDALVAKGYAVRAPCLWQGACPALVKESDWCHAERPWKVPALVEELAKRAGLHKDALKMSYLAVAPKGEAWPALPSGRLFRIVSEPLEGKGRQRYIGCGPEGRIGLALQEKHRNPANEAFFALRRGDVLRLEGTEAKGDGLALGAESKVEVLARAGQRLRGDDG